MDLEALAHNAHGIRSLARSLLRDDAEAEDVVQEAYLAALRKPPGADAPRRASIGVSAPPHAPRASHSISKLLNAPRSIAT